MSEYTNYTYILECSDKSLYTGWTTDLEHRVQQHNLGKGAKYTRTRTPVRLVYYESFATKEEAMKREYAIKQMKRQDKLCMIQNTIHMEKRIACEKDIEEKNDIQEKNEGKEDGNR